MTDWIKALEERVSSMGIVRLHPTPGVKWDDMSRQERAEELVNILDHSALGMGRAMKGECKVCYAMLFYGDENHVCEIERDEIKVLRHRLQEQEDVHEKPN